jgi:peptide/nickel transport system permease protein
MRWSIRACGMVEWFIGRRQLRWPVGAARWGAQPVWRRFLHHHLAVVGAAAILALVMLAVLAPWIAPYRFQQIDLGSFFARPSRAHWLGADELGHDVLTRILYAGRISLFVGIVTAAVSVGIGSAVGLMAGYYGRFWDRVVMRIADVFVAIPAIAMMFVLAKVMGPGIRSIIVVLSAFGWMATARLTRAEVLRMKHLEFIEAARCAGASDGRILFKHLLPNALAPVIVSATLFVGVAILSESTISYFGLGIQPPVPSWGNMLLNAQSYLWTAPWLAVYPGLAILITVLSFNLVGDGLRDAMDPRLRL